MQRRRLGADTLIQFTAPFIIRLETRKESCSPLIGHILQMSPFSYVNNQLTVDRVAYLIEKERQKQVDAAAASNQQALVVAASAAMGAPLRLPAGMSNACADGCLGGHERGPGGGVPFHEFNPCDCGDRFENPIWR